MGASEKVSQRYAEIFVSAFNRVMDDPTYPVVSISSMAQAGAVGVPFRGSNALLTSLTASGRGFVTPVWFTRKRIEELNLCINKGERNTPIVKYDIYYEDTRTGKRDPDMDDATYNTLSDEDRKNWVKRCYMNAYPEFNLMQTDFAEKYPDQWEDLKREFGQPREKVDCPVLDAMVSGDGWLCPIRVSDGYGRMSYVEKNDEIRCATKASYPDEHRYYGDLAYALARSTGSEGRLDRDINSPVLERAAMEELVSELAASTVCALAGVNSCIQEHNMVHLKAWINAIGEDPMVIFKAVNEASKAAELVSSTLGLEQRPGFNLDRLMDGVESAREAQEKARERREARAKRNVNWKAKRSPHGGRKK